MVIKSAESAGEAVGRGLVVTGECLHELPEHRQFPEQSRAHEEVGVRALDARVGIPLHDGIEGFGTCFVHEVGEVLGGIGHLGSLPSQKSPDAPGGRVVTVEDGEHVVSGE